MDNKYEMGISASPHLHSRTSTAKIMWTVVACLLPAGAWGVYAFGLNALWVILISIGSAMLCEFAVTAALKQKLTLGDGSAVLTGLLVAYNMPPGVPGFIPLIASAFAIIVVKQTFGGLGRNFMNPALAGRAFAMFCWTKEMTTWSLPAPFAIDVFTGATDAMTGASPLQAKSAALFLAKGSYLDLFLGNIPGCIGETSKLLLLAGGLILLATKVITWEIPTAYLGTFGLLIWIFGGPQSGGLFSGDVLFHFLSGGLVLGAFFMATDMATSPLTRIGMLIFGAGCGFFTFFIRIFGSLPEGVSLSIILMNITVPLINKFTKQKKFGALTERRNNG